MQKGRHDELVARAGAALRREEPTLTTEELILEVGLVLNAVHGAMLVRRSVFFELGGFEPDYVAYLEDVDLCWRAWLRGYEVMIVPAAVAYHHYGASGGGRQSPYRIRLMQRNP